MAEHLTTADEGEFAGYVDAGIWALEQYLSRKAAQEQLTIRFIRELWEDFSQ